MAFISRIVLLLLCGPTLLQGQEVKYLDLSSTRQRTELRHPPSPPCECKEGGCMCGGSGGGSVGDGAPDYRDPRALGVYLLQVTPTEIHTDEPFEVEFKVLNTGRFSIELPIHPHLSDLQPADETVAFSYFSVALVVRGESEPEGQGFGVPALGFVELYGSHEHEGDDDRTEIWRMDSRQGDSETSHLAHRISVCTTSRQLLVAEKHFSPAAGRLIHGRAKSVSKHHSHAADPRALLAPVRFRPAKEVALAPLSPRRGILAKLLKVRCGQESCYRSAVSC